MPGPSRPTPICSRRRSSSCGDGSWGVAGFRNLEPRGEDGFFIHDPIPVTLDDEGYLVAR